MCFCHLLCVRIEIDHHHCVNCWVIIHCLSVSCTTINHSRCVLVIWSSLQLTSKQWIITQQFTAEADLSLKLMLTSQKLYIQFHGVGTYELLPISQKSLKISNWNFTCTLQGYIGIRKYQYLNFDQVPHLDPKSHGWSHMKRKLWSHLHSYLNSPRIWYSWQFFF